MKCLITGCAFVEPESDRWAVGDLLQTDEGTWVFNAATNSSGETHWLYGSARGEPRCNKHIRATSHWERRGVFIIGSEHIIFNQAAKDYIE